ncbi:SDR family oxidoreductase [Nocardia sp. NPDC059228]|uniref:SDR family oxidoreductase n=1 Tax=Nocardia sp. NPDC059228 TaxID=3346777 RepID=UPI0036CF5A69
MQISFQDKTVIVTGGAGGFGEATSRTFGSSGANVVIADVNLERAQAVAADLPSAIAVETDVLDESAMKNVVKTAVDTYGCLDVMVNNAGLPHLSGPMIEMDTETVDWQFAVNVRSVFLGCKYAALAMQNTGGGGVIVNTASIAGRRPRPGLTIYNATKGAVITLTRSLASELGPQIRVNAVNPLVSQTGFIKNALGVDQLGAEAVAAMTANVPIGRMTEPQDVANAIAYLASDQASMLTGVCLDVDGGRSIQ